MLAVALLCTLTACRKNEEASVSSDALPVTETSGDKVSSDETSSEETVEESEVPTKGEPVNSSKESGSSQESGADVTVLNDGNATITLAEDTTPIYRNPGKGFVFYGVIPDTLSAEEIAKGNLVYCRIEWATLEPKEGQYQWWIVENYLKQAQKYGMKFALGVMNASGGYGPEDGYTTPKWVFDAGARYYEITDDRGVVNKIPYWKENPIFFQKLGNFIKALSKRYNGHPDFAFIDIRSFGNWGEFHTGGIEHTDQGEFIGYLTANEVFDLYIDPYIKAFPDTQLMLPYGMTAHKAAYEKAVAQGVGMRRDGIPDWSDGSDIAFASGRVMTVAEYGDTLQALVNSGKWDDQKVTEALMRAGVSYAEIGRGTGYDGNLNFIEHRKDFMASIANKIGYHFVLESVKLPMTVRKNQSFSLTANWANKGVTRLFNEPCHVAVALLDKNGKAVDICWPDTVDPKKWTPGKHTEKSTVKFAKAKKGTYRLAVGLFLKKENQKPDYRLGNKGETGGWYTISENFIIS